MTRSRLMKRAWSRRRRSEAMKASWAKRKNAARVDVTAVPPTSDLDNIRVQIERAHSMLQDGITLCNEAWDIINSIPKRL